MRILICSDGHAAAEQALAFVARHGQAWEARVSLLGIIEHDGDEAALRAALERGAARLRERGIFVEILLQTGAPLPEIRRHTEGNAYDFVAIGTERKANGTFALAQKAYDLVRELEPPVLLLPAGGGAAEPGAARILLCSGGRRGAAPAADLAIRLARQPRLAVTLLHVMPEAPGMFANLAAREIDPKRLLASRSALARQLREERELIRAAGLEASVVLRQGAVAREILEEARQGNYDFIVMGAAPAQGPVRHYVMGDVAAAVLKETEHPVLILRTAAAERRKGAWLARWWRVFRGGGAGP